MQLSPNPFLSNLKSGKKQIGLWISLCSGYAADVVSHSGYDWVLLDMEHAPNDVPTVVSQLQAMSASASNAIVRPDWNDSVKIKRVLDLGAQSVLIPMIQNVEEAKQAVAACRYPPQGIRGVAGATRATAYGRTKDYFHGINDETAIILQLETRAALEQAEEIATVDGVSGVFFGPADIAADIGKLGQPMDPAVWDVILPVAQKLIARGIPVGTLVLDDAFAAKLLNEGFSFVACGMDIAMLAKTADSLLESVKAQLD